MEEQEIYSYSCFLKTQVSKLFYLYINIYFTILNFFKILTVTYHSSQWIAFKVKFNIHIFALQKKEFVS